MGRGVKRGEVWTAAGGAPYASKPRPVVILQTDFLGATLSVLVCPLTTDPTEAPLFRPLIAPSPENGLREPCRAMTDKLFAPQRANVSVRIGRLAAEDVAAVERAVAFTLGLGS